MTMNAPLAAAAATPLLDVQNVSLAFGGLKAVSDVTLRIPERALYGLIGPNGAGKTTLFNLLTGVYQPDAGDIRLGGESLVGKRPYQIAAAGAARTFQNIRLFGQLTVLENVLVACENLRRSTLTSALLRSPFFYKDEQEMTERALSLLSVFKLEDMADEISTSLSYGNQRRLEIARAMMLKPKLLLLDEPAAGMNEAESTALIGQVRGIRDRFGCGIIVIDHDLRFIMTVCERINVLHMGELIAGGPPSEIQNDPRVIEVYIGGRRTAEAAARAAG